MPMDGVTVSEGEGYMGATTVGWRADDTTAMEGMAQVKAVG